MAGLWDQARKLANTERGEKVTDSVLDTVAGLVSKRTGGTHDAQIQRARRAVDEHLGRTDRKGEKKGDPKPDPK